MLGHGKNEGNSIAERASCISAGGIFSRKGYVAANNIIVSSNNGPGIYGLLAMSFMDVRSLDNKGPGIYSFNGMVHVRTCAECTNQVTGNMGDGIYSGILHGSPDSAWGVVISHPITIISNSMKGIWAESDIGINIVPPDAAVQKGTSFIKDNATGAKCWEVKVNQLDRVKKVRCTSAAKGGVYSRYGSVTARYVEVTGNGDKGIGAAEGLDIAEGRVCSNTGGNLFTGGLPRS